MPEIKPARPDPVDMDEDEKEMLSEARARLANTKGKKAKRKAREKVLEEARRLAQLQKLRELKAAGVDVASRRKAKKPEGIDYAVEIPFERRAPAGFHDTTLDDAALLQASASESMAFKVRKLNEIEQERRSEAEARERTKERSAARRAAASSLPSLLAEAAQADPMALRKRPRLALPAPVLSLAELEDIASLGGGGGVAGGIGGAAHPAHSHLLSMGEDAWGESGVGGAGEGGASGGLGDDGRASSIMASTAVARARAKGGSGAPSRERLLEEARNQAALKASWAPVLEGGENVELEAGTGFQGASVRGCSSGARGGAGSLTPHARDSAAQEGEDSVSQHGGGSCSRGILGGGLEAARRVALMRALGSLPVPKNKLEVAAPELPQEQEDAEFSAASDPAWAGSSALHKDAALLAAAAAAEAKAEAAREAARRSAVLKHAPPPLPRPLVLDEEALAPPVGSSSDYLAFAQGMIQDELVLLLKSDAAKYPVRALP
jgi:pre-mRNA-splicing factor CDC5/CEF1